MKVLIVFALVSVLTVSAVLRTPQCVDLEKKGEMGLKKLLLLEKDAKIPRDMDAVNARCDDAKEFYKNLIKYKSCVTDPLQQTLFTTTTQSILKLIKDNCEKDENKQRTLEVLKCVPEETVKEAQRCAVGAFNVLRLLAKSSKPKGEMIKEVCCLTHVGSDCARSQFTSISCPSSKSTPDAFFENAMKALSKDTVEMACEEFKSLGICEQRAAEVVARVKESIKAAVAGSSGGGLIEPILEIAGKIAN